MVRRTSLFGTCLLVLAIPGAVRAESVEDVQKAVVDAYGKIKSYTCKSKAVQNMDMGEGNKVQAEYTGTIEWMRKGDKFAIRTEMKGKSVQNFGGQENKMEMDTTMVCDGDMLYTLSKQAGQTMATKQKPTEAMAGEPKRVFADLIAKHNLKVLPEEKVDGQACFVLEAIPKDPAEAAMMAKSVLYFRKDAGFNVKTVGYNKDGKEIITNSTFDYKVNPDIAADRFVFKAPEGVQVMDLTGGGGGAPDGH